MYTDEDLTPVYLRILGDGCLLERDQWRVDCMWDLAWSSILDEITIAQDKEIIRLAELRGESITDTLLNNLRLFRYL